MYYFLLIYLMAAVAFIAALIAVERLLLMPNYFRDKPKEDMLGVWELGVIKVTPFSRRYLWQQRFEGRLHKAYRLVRAKALEYDMEIPVHPDGEVGIDWEIVGNPPPKRGDERKENSENKSDIS